MPKLTEISSWIGAIGVIGGVILVTLNSVTDGTVLRWLGFSMVHVLSQAQVSDGTGHSGRCPYGYRVVAGFCHSPSADAIFQRSVDMGENADEGLGPGLLCYWRTAEGQAGRVLIPVRVALNCAPRGAWVPLAKIN